MKIIVLICFVGISLARAEPALKARSPVVRDFYGLKTAIGSLCVYSWEGDDGKVYGPIQVWWSSESKESIEIRSLAALDEVCRREVTVLGPTAEKAAVVGRVAMIYGMYLGARNDCMLIAPPLRDGFLLELRRHVPTEQFALLEALLVSVPSKIAEDGWTISVVLLSEVNAIERRTLSGTTAPFGVRKEVIEILVPVGAIPRIEFVPKPDQP